MSVYQCIYKYNKDITPYHSSIIKSNQPSIHLAHLATAQQTSRSPMSCTALTYAAVKRYPKCASCCVRNWDILAGQIVQEDCDMIMHVKSCSNMPQIYANLRNWFCKQFWQPGFLLNVWGHSWKYETLNWWLECTPFKMTKINTSA